jgi:hypothetical protein
MIKCTSCESTEVTTSVVIDVDRVTITLSCGSCMHEWDLEGTLDATSDVEVARQRMDVIQGEIYEMEAELGKLYDSLDLYDDIVNPPEEDHWGSEAWEEPGDPWGEDESLMDKLGQFKTLED